MSLATLVISEDLTVASQIEELVNASNDLQLIEVTSRGKAVDSINSKNPRVVWIELSPDSEGGLNLLGSLKESKPDIHYLVSNVTLEGDLVKKSMQLGAVDFLDSKTWSQQLPDVTARVIAQEMSIQRELKRKEKIQEMLESQKQKSADPAVKNMRQKARELDEAESSAGGIMLGVIILLALGAAFYFFMF